MMAALFALFAVPRRQPLRHVGHPRYLIVLQITFSIVVEYLPLLRYLEVSSVRILEIGRDRIAFSPQTLNYLPVSVRKVLALPPRVHRAH